MFSIRKNKESGKKMTKLTARFQYTEISEIDADG